MILSGQQHFLFFSLFPPPFIIHRVFMIKSPRPMRKPHLPVSCLLRLWFLDCPNITTHMLSDRKAAIAMTHGLFPGEATQRELNVPIVAEIGRSSTKLGWAGETHPRSYCSSDVAITDLHSEGDSNAKHLEKGQSGTSSGRSSTNKHGPERKTLDGSFGRANPVDPQTGLLSLDGDDEDGRRSIDAFHHVIANGMNQCMTTNSPNSDHSGMLEEIFSNTVIRQPFMMIEKSYSPQKLRTRLTEIAFEQFEVPKFFLAKDAAMSCYGVGRSSGIVVDIGASGTTVSPVHDGWVESTGVLRSRLGGDVMDKYMLSKIDSLGKRTLQHSEKPSTIYSQRWDWISFARGVKESIACVALFAQSTSVDEARKSNSKKSLKEYVLPDGTTIRLPTDRINRELGEILFRPEDLSPELKEDINGSRIMEEKKGSSKEADLLQVQYLSPVSLRPIHHLVCDAAFRCDRDQQVLLLEQVVVTGGGACLPGLTDRIKREVESLIHTHTPGWNVKVSSPNFPERAIGPWLGGSILACLPLMEECWITKKDYEECGASIVNRMCP
jgi:actin-related protein